MFISPLQTLELMHFYHYFILNRMPLLLLKLKFRQGYLLFNGHPFNATLFSYI